MKKIIMLMLFCLLPSLAYAQPSLVLDKETHDFGTIQPTESISFDFEFANNGTEDLVIDKLVPS
jgi:hypothetical protein